MTLICNYLRVKIFLLILCVVLCITSFGQNKRGYAIDPELKKLSNFNPPVNKVILPFASAFMELMPKKIDKKKVVYESFSVGEAKIHIITPRSKTEETTPCLFYIHGGGFIFKASANHYAMEQEYALGAGCRVVGIDYSLAPKHPFPTALNECLEGYRFKRFDDTPGWNSVDNSRMWEWYLAGQEYVSPLERHGEFDLQHLFVEVEEFDCLHDEGVMIYEALSAECGHSVLLDNKGTFHGYDINLKAGITRKSLRKRIDFLVDANGIFF